MSISEEQLNTYLRTTGVKVAAPSVHHASLLLQQHVTKFAFTSANVLLERELPLNINALMDRLVKQRVGGYCYEHNALLFEVFTAMGYSVECRLARVVLPHGDPTRDTPLTHRLNVITIQGVRYLAEGGFSHMTAAQLLPFPPVNGPSSLNYRVRQLPNNEYLYELHKNRKWIPLYRFEDRSHPESDLLMGHFWSHRHPDAPFVNNLVASLVTPNRTLSLQNSVFWCIEQKGTSEKRIHTAEELLVLLRDEFELNLSTADCEILFNLCQ